MIVTSEEPNIHWGFLEVKGKNILDLGCSKFAASISTPEYFIESGADYVVGIDMGDMGWQHPKFKMVCMTITKTSQIQSLLDTYNPNIIKCDIEGWERTFEEIKELPNVNEIAIEYHDNTLKLMIERKLIEWGFGTPDLHQLFDIEIERMGVLHAKK